MDVGRTDGQTDPLAVLPLSFKADSTAAASSILSPFAFRLLVKLHQETIAQLFSRDRPRPTTKFVLARNALCPHSLSLFLPSQIRCNSWRPTERAEGDSSSLSFFAPLVDTLIMEVLIRGLGGCYIKKFLCLLWYSRAQWKSTIWPSS